MDPAGGAPGAAGKRGKRDKRRDKPRKEKPVLAEAVAGATAGDSKFARALGSTDYMTREKGLQALQRWLCLRSDLAEGDMLKIWKGLFFCFWHSDKAPVQVRGAPAAAASRPRSFARAWLDPSPGTAPSCRPVARRARGGKCGGARSAHSLHGPAPPARRARPLTPPPSSKSSLPPQADLAQRLASLLPQLPPPTAALYFNCFLATMRREWFAIDYHRLDKFLMLVRRVVVAALGLLRDRGW